MGRPKVYSSGLYLVPLKRIWLASDQPCGKRLKMALPLWLPHYGGVYDELDPTIYKGLLSMSAATMDRLLTPSRVKCKRFCGTKPGSRPGTKDRRFSRHLRQSADSKKRFHSSMISDRIT